jgi:DNA mismatch repair protein MutL
VTTTQAIRVLPDALVARIAAGEVITRPRAAVKELVDNAIDAGATRIDIAIQAGGYDLIAVHDDGSGIRSNDAPVVFTRHATSKLTSLDALTQVRTLGFRGEALASLAAVADVEIRSRHRDEALGTRIGCAFGGSVESSPIARQSGTSVVARDIFARYPVRRNGVDPAAEGRAIRRLVGHLALTNPGIALCLSTDGRTVLQTDGRGLRAAFAALNGSESLPYMLDVGPLLADGVNVTGIVSGPAVHRGNRDGLVLSVNGRLCGAPDLQRAVERAYVDVLPRQRYPQAVLMVDAPPERVDVNVHPAKERVVIHEARALATALERDLRALLGRTTHLIAEKRSLALQAADLPGLRLAESGGQYATGEWGARIVEVGSLPRLRVVGQVEDTLIVCESEVGTLLIDQHRAHERVIFERLMAQESVPLPEACLLALPSATLALLDARHDDLHDAGWRWQEFGAGQLLVSACPAGLEPDDLLPIAERFAAETAHSIIAASACHAAIRKRRPLTPEAAAELVSALTATPTPTTCPHGQPIVLNLDRAFLERQFGWR